MVKQPENKNQNFKYNFQELRTSNAWERTQDSPLADRKFHCARKNGLTSKLHKAAYSK
jgi:hypothetical protein